MSEDTHNEHRDPFLGKWGASAIATVSGGLLLLVISGVINAPKEADVEIKQSIAQLEREVDELRETYNEHRANSQARFEELKIKVDAGTDDRYRQQDAERDFSKIYAIQEEREQRTRSDISRLDSQNQALIQYLTEERRYQGGKNGN